MKDTTIIPKPIKSKTAGLIKKSLKENIPIHKMVENGRDSAKMFTAKLISKVGFVCLSSSSIELIALIWANGQKLHELCGNTTNKRINGVDSAGNSKMNMADKQNVMPALRVKSERISPNSPDFIRTAIPMNKSISGVIITLILNAVSFIKVGNESKLKPNDNNKRPAIMTIFIGSLIRASPKPLSLLEVVGFKSCNALL